MTRAAITALAAVTMTGCASMSDGQPTSAQYAAFAARSKLPDGAADGLQATAVVNRDDETIRVLNPTDCSIRNAKLWVNGNFVTPVENVPSYGAVTLERDEFFDASGRPLTESDTTVRTVQLEEGGKLYNLLGPVFE